MKKNYNAIHTCRFEGAIISYFPLTDGIVLIHNVHLCVLINSKYIIYIALHL